MTTADDSTAPPVATYLRDDRYGLRAPVPEDAEHAIAWYEGAFPISPATAGKLLSEHETIPWGGNPTIRLIVVELATGDVVGGATVERQDNRVGKLVVISGGPDRSGERAQDLRAAVLRLLVPWMMDELNLMVAQIDIPADESILIDAATGLEMVEAVRLRASIARPTGRVDLVTMELVDRTWGTRDA